MIKHLKEHYKISNKKIPVKPIIRYYDKTYSDKQKSNIIAIMTISNDIVPVKEVLIDNNWAIKQGYILEHQKLYDKIDEEIYKKKEKGNRKKTS